MKKLIILIPLLLLSGCVEEVTTNITCTKCESGAFVIQDFVDVCPEGWNNGSEPIICEGKILCYQCNFGKIIYNIFSSASCPEGWFNISPKCNKVIYNTNNNIWEPIGSNIQAAIDDAGPYGEIWLPAGVFEVPYLHISNNGTKIHGAGPKKTIIHFTGDRYGIMASQHPGNNQPSDMKWGLNDIQLDNFSFTGSNIELVIRNNALLENLDGYDITIIRPGAIRFIVPYTGDNDRNNIADYPNEAKTENIQVIRCNVSRSSSFGFGITTPSFVTQGFVVDNFLFDNCTSWYAGCCLWPEDEHDSWSSGFDFAEASTGFTVKNGIIRNCQAWFAWESGFHFESKPTKENIQFFDCISNYNGQKYIHTTLDCPTCSIITDQNLCDTYPSDGCFWWSFLGLPEVCHKWSETPYGSGWMYLNSAMTLTRCQAYGNSVYGFRGTSGSLPSLINCSGDAYPTIDNGNGYAIAKVGYENYGYSINVMEE